MQLPRILTLALGLTMIWGGASEKASSQTLDIDSFMGDWFEVASTKPIFQRNCFCSRTTYELVDDKIMLVNSCNVGSVDGKIREVSGTARPTFFLNTFSVDIDPFSRFLRIPNYSIVEYDTNYEWAVVSTFIKRPIWILSRAPELDSEVMETIIQDLQNRGYPVTAIKKTDQTGCP